MSAATKIQDGRAHELPVQNSALVATHEWLYCRHSILSFVEIHSGVSEPQFVENQPSLLLWLVAFRTAWTDAKAVTPKSVSVTLRHSLPYIDMRHVSL